jgi:hypothetical protein
VLPEVQPSNSCDGCDSKHDHQKSQQFHSSPAGAGADQQRAHLIQVLGSSRNYRETRAANLAP